MKKVTRDVAIILIAFTLVFLDVYYFSFLSVKGVIMLSSSLMVIIFSLLQTRDQFYILALSTVIFMAIFSSLPSWLVVVIYLIIPASILYLRNNFLPEPSIISSLFYFIPALSLVSLFMMIGLAGWNMSGLVTSIYFIIANSLFGFFLFTVIKTLRQRGSANRIRI